MNGTTLPRPTAVGEWTQGANRATLAVTVANAAPAETRVEAAWTSPLVRSRGHCFGRLESYYRHDAHTPPGGHMMLAVRFRGEGGRWSKWRALVDEEFEIPPRGMGVGHGYSDDCVFVFDRVPHRRVQLGVRHVIRYLDTLRGTVDLDVTVP